MIVLITGGARSGKSKFAEQYAAHIGREGIYIATSEVLDKEMEKRVAEHVLRRKQSPIHWETEEAPLHLVDTLERIRVQSRSVRAKERVILVDCLTIWLSNCLLHQFGEEGQIEDESIDQDDYMRNLIEQLVSVLQKMDNPVLLVTNEVGNGVVPPYKLGRLFRDWSGWMNQRLAEISDHVFLVTAGIPIDLKAIAFRWE